MGKNNIILWGAIILLAIGVIWSLDRTGLVGPIGPQGPLGANTGPDNNYPCVSQNGFTTCISNADMPDSTSTLVSVKNPLGATSTIDFVQLENTGLATSSYQFSCGPAQSGAGAPDILWINSGFVATSSGFGTVVNNATTSAGFIGSIGGQGGNGTGIISTSTRLTLKPLEFFVCQAKGVNGEAPLGNSGGWDSAFVNGTNAFTGKFKIRWLR